MKPIQRTDWFDMLTLKAPAKINWFLKILGLRNDGFHEIQSLIQKVTLFDILTFIPLDGNLTDSDSPSGDLVVETDGSIPVEENIVYRAARLLKDRYRIDRSVLIRLDKNIPVGAGLGGGSSDAATTLIGLNDLWELGLSREDLHKLAEQLGSDVPFFLYGSLSFVEGRGEKITPCRATIPLGILLVKPSFSVSSAWAYKSFSAEQSMGSGGGLTKKDHRINNIEHFIHAFEEAELSTIADFISNDLYAVVAKRFPVVAEIKERLSQEGAIISLMSGSGPTVFGVFGSLKEAEEASKAFKGCWTAAVQTIVEELKDESCFGASTSGKSGDFGSPIRRFESSRPSH